MIDTSKFTLDTSVKIKIMTPGYYIQELSSYTPLECYCSIEKIIAILNRGIVIDFPQQHPKEQEISKKIEDFLLEYVEKQNKLKEKHGDVGTDVNEALDTIQEINDSKETIDDIHEEANKHIFDYDDITQRVAKNLQASNVDKIFESDFFMDPDKRVEEESKRRKSKERVTNKRKEALQQLTMETEALRKLTQDGKFDFEQIQHFDDVELSEPKPSKN